MPKSRKPVVPKPGGKYTVSALAIGDAGCKAVTWDGTKVTFHEIRGWLTFTNEMTDGSEPWVLTPMVIFNHSLQTADTLPKYAGYCEKALSEQDVVGILTGTGPKLGGFTFPQAPAKA
ncbi:MAG: hypothetical protein ACLQDQ_05400 [Myxococcaceae bacterium]